MGHPPRDFDLGDSWRDASLIARSKTRVHNSTANLGHLRVKASTANPHANMHVTAELIHQGLDGLQENFGVTIDVGGGGGGGHQGHVVEWSKQDAAVHGE